MTEFNDVETDHYENGANPNCDCSGCETFRDEQNAKF